VIRLLLEDPSPVGGQSLRGMCRSGVVSLNKLSARKVETLSKPGWHNDGGGLYLRITEGRSTKWIYVFKRDKKRREMGLGSLADVSLAQARELAVSARQMVKDGLDPIEERKAAAAQAAEAAVAVRAADRPTPLFGSFADTYIDTHEEGWRNPKHRQQWRNTIKTHAKPLLMKPVDAITSDDVLVVLKPIWTRIPETAGRLRSRIENILDAAKASKHIASPWENPARWKGNLIHLLPRRKNKKQVRHHAAIPYEEMPDFMRRLRSRPAIAARALELTVLCATRTNETLKMRWSEVNLQTEVWTIPKERMKMNIEHRIPLPPRAIEIIREIPRGSECNSDSYVFPGQSRGSPLSQMSMTMLLRRMKLGHYTVHGMRSSFRDYMGDMTHHAESTVEQALAHQVGDETSRAYRRGDAFLKRRQVLRDWETYLYASPRKKRRGKSEVTSIAA